ncbi:AhpD family alkylhydroperoxidase [Stackebrandtia endophytica]|uniref:AhpD family alkylhydroperoxidase n=1 Tax=Stackebrandtia endophytica TaxID=1496996 RepID=A0A543B3M0_9ACTN|nr:carboxymuconolactone decarboxylase family protein [Stackebrandtia endophytica]TQL79429.1 AhpD family alkylhydroperoxidase [Stackebrandtia endophytica]
MEYGFDLMSNELGVKLTKRFSNVNALVQQSELSRSTQELVGLRVSQINGCGWCTDIHSTELARTGEGQLRLNLVAAWRESTVFTAAERAALALAEEGTRIADASPGVSDATWEEVREHYTEDQIAALVYLIALVNGSTRVARIVRKPGGDYEPGMFVAIAD